MDELSRRLDAFIEGGRDPWARAYRGLATGDLWLTEDETRELNDAVMELVDGFERKRPVRRPAGSRRATYAWLMMPLEPPPDTETGSPR